MSKSTTSEIRARFDADVERFSHLETGQVSTVDARLTLELITEAAAALAPDAKAMLDVGCGAGNYTLMMLERLPRLECTLVDLSQNMLDRAVERLQNKASKVEAVCGDIREAALPENHFDIILTGACLHHLRDDGDWEQVFRKLYGLLKKGGVFFISDYVAQETPALDAMMRRRWGDYLTKLGGEAYRDKTFAYVDHEDTPRPVTYQLDLMRRAGFSQVEILHKNTCFAAFGGIK